MSQIENSAPPCFNCHSPMPVKGGTLPSGGDLCPSCWTWHYINARALTLVIEAMKPGKATP